jgi:glycerol uptake facilitator-like aquaporin
MFATHRASEEESVRLPRPCCRWALQLALTIATASTSLANPAVTIARSLSDTFAGIAPSGVAFFVVAQRIGMALAVAVSRWFWEEATSARPERVRSL